MSDTGEGAKSEGSAGKTLAVSRMISNAAVLVPAAGAGLTFAGIATTSGCSMILA